jgi:hypothetical protein
VPISVCWLSLFATGVEIAGRLAIASVSSWLASGLADWLAD